jgi:RNA polymerase sigma factor (sigma-70 family)
MIKLQELELAPDEELMLAYQDGNETAFTLLYRRYSGKIYGYLMSRLKDRSTSDDAFQATFLKLHQSRMKYDPNFPFSAWLFTLCRTSMIDVIRTRVRIQKREGQDDVAFEGAAAAVPDEIVDVPDLSSLTQNQRDALLHRYIDELSFEQIAKRLAISPVNTRKIVSRALKQLRTMIQGGHKK